jgi:uronate dehydrogenase
MADLVLVTGSSGRIGRAVVRELQQRGRPVRGFDLAATPGLADMVVGDVTDVRALERAMEGARAVVHLAAIPDDDDFLTRLLPGNIVGVYHVFETAQRAGVKRMILASSGQVVWYQRFTGPLPIRADTQPSPRYWYGVCKMFLEGAGRAFADKYQMEVVAVRLGWVPRDAAHAEELRGVEWGPDVYLSPGDAGRCFACFIDAPGPIHFKVVYATSKPVRTMYYDMEPARELGFEPRDQWPTGATGPWH